MRADTKRRRSVIRRLSTVAAAAVLILTAGFGASPSVALGADPPPELIWPTEFIMGPVATDHLLLGINGIVDPTSIPDPADFRWHAIVPEVPTVPPDVPATDVTFLYEGLRYGDPFGAFPDGLSVLRLDLGATLDPAATIYLDYTRGDHPLQALDGTPMAEFTDLSSTFVDDEILADDVVPVVDDAIGPDHVLLAALRPFDPVLPPASDFHVFVTGEPVPRTPTAIRLGPAGIGIGVVDLKLTTPINSTDVVRVTYTPTSPVLRFLGGPATTPDDIDAIISLPATPSRSTPVGSNVTVTPADASTGAATTSVTFVSVTASGNTTVTSSPTGPAAPAGFTFGSPAIFYDLGSTATFTSASVCFTYDPTDFAVPESALRLLHFEGGAWADKTAPGSPDTANHRICGTVSSFSPFTVAGRLPFPFSGFFSPVDNQPTVNSAKAGSGVPVAFALGGNRGLSIFAAGSPASQAVGCQSGAPVDDLEQTASPGAATLSYDAASGRYTYVWKTDRSWKGCRRLVLGFADGTSQTALFQFK